MISLKTHSLDWLNEKKNQLRTKDPIIIEKVIKALTLLEQLQTLELDFVFKGGTSLLLLIKDFNRFSIDIDIIISGGKRDLLQVLKKIADRNIFTNIIEDVRQSSNTPKSHFKFYYQSVVGASEKNSYILLDVLFEENKYSDIKKIRIENTLLDHTGQPAIVKIPSINSIISDKLTAFAPETTGIPYFRGKEEMGMEIIKQLNDISVLFDHVNDLNVTRNDFDKIAQSEISYRNLKVTPDEVLSDSFQTALIISMRGATEAEKFQILQDGIKRMEGYFFQKSFYIEDAILCASKIAYLTMLLQHNKPIERYTDKDQVKDLTILKPKYSKLNKLKKSSPESFFFWYKALVIGEKLD